VTVILLPSYVHFYESALNDNDDYDDDVDLFVMVANRLTVLQKRRRLTSDDSARQNETIRLRKTDAVGSRRVGVATRSSIRNFNSDHSIISRLNTRATNKLRPDQTATVRQTADRIDSAIRHACSG